MIVSVCVHVCVCVCVCVHVLGAHVGRLIAPNTCHYLSHDNFVCLTNGMYYCKIFFPLFLIFWNLE